MKIPDPAASPSREGTNYRTTPPALRRGTLARLVAVPGLLGAPAAGASLVAGLNPGEAVTPLAVPAAQAAPATSAHAAHVINPDGLLTPEQEKSENGNLDSLERYQHITLILDFENSFNGIDAADFAEQVWKESGKGASTVVFAASAERKWGFHSGSDLDASAVNHAIESNLYWLHKSPPDYYAASNALVTGFYGVRHPSDTTSISSTHSIPTSINNGSANSGAATGVYTPAPFKEPWLFAHPWFGPFFPLLLAGSVQAFN